jgi:hypothetical protein
MKVSLEKHLSRLDEYQARNAYMLCGDVDPRACCKSLRERLKRCKRSMNPTFKVTT